ncbi:hypothetical protein [Haloarcula litorea]|uniref:hypothetical protein n=1 Tax=Haloarcula litorea TaxID=3032579 RepID=UPI0023E887B4|nr:hypothetical protein [Halomicroarcula sp. GDY20]
MADAAERVVLTVAADSPVRTALDRPSYRQYLRRSRDGPVRPGETWAETAPRGCGTTEPISLRVAAVEGGTVLGPETAIEFEYASE